MDKRRPATAVSARKYTNLKGKISPGDSRWNWPAVLQPAIGTVLAAVVLGILGFLAPWIYRLIYPPLIAEQVYWSPHPPGMTIRDEKGNWEGFIKWPALRGELRRELLPQLGANIPPGLDFVVTDFHGKKNWAVELIDVNKKALCWIWFGEDPENDWKVDGRLRIGCEKAAVVWQTYQRFSNGSYYRVKMEKSLDLVCKDPPCVNP